MEKLSFVLFLCIFSLFLFFPNSANSQTLPVSSSNNNKDDEIITGMTTLIEESRAFTDRVSSIAFRLSTRIDKLSRLNSDINSDEEFRKILLSQEQLEEKVVLLVNQDIVDLELTLEAIINSDELNINDYRIFFQKASFVNSSIGDILLLEKEILMDIYSVNE